MFYLQGPADCGIPLRDALTGKYIRLVGRDDPMFRERGPSVSIRLRVSYSTLVQTLLLLTLSESSGQDTETGLGRYDLYLPFCSNLIYCVLDPNQGLQEPPLPHYALKACEEHRPNC